MAAPTVTFFQLKPMQIANTRVGMMTGSINYGNYDNTHPASGIGGRFLNLTQSNVIIDITTNGYVAQWLPANDGIKLWATGAASGAALAELANATAAGSSMNFMATGFFR